MSATYPRGFDASGVAAGIKPDGIPDLALIVSSDRRPVVSAGVFTTSKAAAAPVRVSKDNLRGARAGLVGVVLSSGNANAATGTAGLDHARRMDAAVSESLGVSAGSLAVCSTGLIGIPLPVERIEAAAPSLVNSLGSSSEAGLDAARAIMTTDTFEKVESFEGGTFRVGAMAKGAAMIAPNMATMLAVLTTDARVSRDRLQRALGAAVDLTFNRLTIDGCTSTNDTVLAFASGLADEPDDSFEEAIYVVCRSLADKIALDAEGGSKIVRVRVVGARNDTEALAGARKIAESQLVKCSFLGEDPYWGRLASELGTSGIHFELDRLAVSYQGAQVASFGVAIEFDRAAVAERFKDKEVVVECDLGLGFGSAEVTTVDLGYGYIDENKGTS